MPLTEIATRRLLRDLKEVLEHPLENVTARPLSSGDLQIWHGNVRGEDGAFVDVPVHFLLVFPDDYPSCAPSLYLPTVIPHPNVLRVVDPPSEASGMRWRLALWDCIPGQDGWRSVYTVHSILVQLQAFLLDEDLHFDTTTNKGTIQQAVERAMRLTLPDIGHTSAHPMPPFPTLEELQLAPGRHRKLIVCRPAIAPRKRTRASPSTDTASLPGRPATPATLNGTQAVANGQAKPESAAQQPVPPAANPATNGEGTGSDGWVQVRKRHGEPSTSVAAPKAQSVISQASSYGQTHNGGESAAALAISANAVPTVPAHNPFAVLGLARRNNERVTANGHHPPAGHPPAALSACSGVAPALSEVADEAAVPLTASARKNAARSRRRAARNAATGVEAAAGTSTAAPTSAGPQPSADMPTASSNGNCASAVMAALVPSSSASAPAEAPADDWAHVKPAKKHAGAANSSQDKAEPQDVASAIRAVYTEVEQESAKLRAARTGAGAGGQMRGSHDASDNLRTAGLSCSMGPYFDSLPPDALAAILGLVSGQDVAALSCTCRGLRAAGEDGEVWRVLLQRAFPASRLSASRLADWKHAFLLEANDIVGDLHCCHTKASYQEAVLGLPVRFTVNPRTGVVDYIEADMDLLSLEAVQAGVTKTTANDAFDALLPLYIDADHFQRALPAYPALLRKLAPEQVGRGGKAPPPQAWLEVLPKMMNTTLVLLCDKGLGLSERALHTYCSLHRLLLALIEHYDLFEAAHQRLDAFLSRPANRVKSACPSLGVLVPLLSVSSKHTWPTAARAIVGESFDRHILWMCQKNPGLAETLAKNPKAGGVDEELLTKGFEGASVSLRLLAFHVVFLRQVARPPGTTLDQVMDSYDALYGRPGAALQRRFKASIRQILEMPNWGAFFATCGLPVVNKAEMTAWLRTSWANSLRKGYHKKDTDFSRVQARGVSKILLKGQQYSAPKNIKRIQVTAHWNYSRATGGYIKWLDTSCLLFNPGQRFTEAVDWEHTISAATQHRGAITHSGMMDNQDDCSGSQIFDIDLSRLGPQIHEMFIAGSAWTDMLIDIRQPFLSIVDPDTKMALCEYHLEDQSRADLRHHKSVILCRVARGAAPGQWQVTAVGMLSQGMALRGRYQPMVDSIAAWTAAQRC